MDIMSGVFLAGGRECKLVTGIDDHSRFVVVAKVVPRPTGRAVCDALAEAVERYGVPAELLTDNGKQFTGRFTKPLPAEVLFERFCRENGHAPADPPPLADDHRKDREMAPDAAPRVARRGGPVRRLRVGPVHAGKTVTVVVEDTYLRVLHDDTELSVHPRTGGAVKRFKSYDRTKN